MDTNRTDITIVLDRSGSMHGVKSDTIGGFNQFMAEQRKAPGSAVITLHQFDDVFETVFSAKDIKTAPDLTPETFQPRNNTALLDAIGRSIKDTGKRLSDQPEDVRPGKVVFVIITDGLENASHKFTSQQVFDMITHQREKYHWQFVYLGANQDAIATAANMGIATANAMTYAHNHLGTVSAYASVSKNLVKMRSGETQCMAFEAQDHELQKQAGV